MMMPSSLDFPCPLPLPESPDIATRADSQQCLRYARAWFEKCQKEHVQCSLPPEVIQLPTRVLDLADTHPRLLVSNGKLGSYAALSYTWGLQDNFTTKRENLKAFQNQLPSSQIPTTIRDAIQVAHNLGLRYLWVDALCIVQDDPLDWEREAGRMAQVYGNADLVIAACSASGSHQGFLHQIRRHPQGSVFSYNERDPSNPYCIKYGMGSQNQLSLDEGPLAKRAWAYQERVLARRYLCYSPEELSWHCNGIETCECSYDKPSSEHSLIDSNRTAWMKLAKDNEANIACLTSEEKSTADIYETWMARIVPAYTKRALTKESDRLIAISAVATRLGQRLQDKLNFGLWQGQMVQQLGWDGFLPKEYVAGAPT